LDAIAGRLETQKKFNADRAKAAANVLEKSLRYAGVLDGSNNILPVRDGASDGGASDQTPDTPGDPTGELGEHEAGPLPPDTLSMEIPVGEDRKVVIRYPPRPQFRRDKKGWQRPECHRRLRHVCSSFAVPGIAIPARRPLIVGTPAKRCLLREPTRGFEPRTPSLRVKCSTS
jgi:hypothetical protein